MTRPWGRVAMAVALADALPSVAAIPAVRGRLTRRLAGAGPAGHVALTIDDGPDPESTPRYLDALAEHGVRATFFLLGDASLRWPREARRVAEAGHEIALHGHRHRPHLLRTPVAVVADLRRGHRAVRDVTGQLPAWWRPPHGIPTASGVVAARALGLRMAPWSADAADWQSGATAQTMARRLLARTTEGGVVLLHDASDGRRAADAVRALEVLLAWCADRGLRAGPLADHGPGRHRQEASWS